MNTLLEALLRQLEFMGEDAVAHGIAKDVPAELMAQLRETEQMVYDYLCTTE